MDDVLSYTLLDLSLPPTGFRMMMSRGMHRSNAAVSLSVPCSSIDTFIRQLLERSISQTKLIILIVRVLCPRALLDVGRARLRQQPSSLSRYSSHLERYSHDEGVCQVRPFHRKGKPRFSKVLR
jgi:hypothetical protein